MEKEVNTGAVSCFGDGVIDMIGVWPDECPLNPGGWDDAPMPNCYEVSVSSGKIGMCYCYGGLFHPIVKNKYGDNVIQEKVFVTCLYK